MNVYTCNKFDGHYPTGVGAVIVASSPEEAKTILEEKLSDIGLFQDVPLDVIKQVNTEVASVIILADGDY